MTTAKVIIPELKSQADKAIEDLVERFITASIEGVTRGMEEWEQGKVISFAEAKRRWGLV